MTDTLKISESDFGLWFEIDGIAIASQPQLDCTLIALAGAYGFAPLPICEMTKVHQVVFDTIHEEDLDKDLLLWLIKMSDTASKFLNNLLPMKDYQFIFTGEDYSKFGLFKV